MASDALDRRIFDILCSDPQASHKVVYEALGDETIDFADFRRRLSKLRKARSSEIAREYEVIRAAAARAGAAVAAEARHAASKRTRAPQKTRPPPEAKASTFAEGMHWIAD